MAKVQMNEIVTTTKQVVVTMTETEAVQLAALLGRFGPELGMPGWYDQFCAMGLNPSHDEYKTYSDIVRAAIKLRASHL